MAAAKPKGKTPPKKTKPKDQPGGAYTYSDTSSQITGYKTPFKNDLANQGKAYLAQSYGKYAADGTLRSGSAESAAVMKSYQDMPKAARVKALAALATKVNNRDFTNWSGSFYSVLLDDLSTGAKGARATAKAGGASVASEAAPSSGNRAAPWENIDLAGGGIPAQGEAKDLGSGPAKAYLKKKAKGKAKAKKATKSATRPKSPGGSKVTPKERKRIQAIKAKNRGR